MRHICYDAVLGGNLTWKTSCVSRFKALIQKNGFLCWDFKEMNEKLKDSARYKVGLAVKGEEKR